MGVGVMLVCDGGFLCGFLNVLFVVVGDHCSICWRWFDLG